MEVEVVVVVGVVLVVVVEEPSRFKVLGRGAGAEGSGAGVTLIPSLARRGVEVVVGNEEVEHEVEVVEARQAGEEDTVVVAWQVGKSRS